MFLMPPALAVRSSPLVLRGGSGGKVSAYNAGNLGLIPGSGRTTGEGNGNPLQYSCLGNPMDKEEPGGRQSRGGKGDVGVSEAGAG